MHRQIINRAAQSKHKLQIGFDDGGHLPLLVIHHSGAKCVPVDEHMDQYKQTGLDYLTNHHAKQLAKFSMNYIAKLHEKIFDLVIVVSDDFSKYDELIQKIQSVDSHFVFVSSSGLVDGRL